MTGIGSIGAVIGRIAAIENRIGVRATAPMAASAAAASTTATTSPLTGLGDTDDLGGFRELLDHAERQSASPALLDAFGSAVRAQPAVSPFAHTSFGQSPVTNLAAAQVPANGTLPADTPFAGLFEAAAERWGIPAPVLAAVGHVESRFRTDAVSSAGAIGVMQFMPATAAGMGVDPTDPTSAIDGAARLLRQMQDRFGSLELALGAYNVGPGTIARAGGIVPGSQSEKYVNAVLTASEQYS